MRSRRVLVEQRVPLVCLLWFAAEAGGSLYSRTPLVVSLYYTVIAKYHYRPTAHLE